MLLDAVGVLVPGDIQPALGRVREAFQRLAIDGVDGYPLARGDDADNAVAGQRMAAAGEMHRHAGDEPADRDGIALAAPLGRFGALAADRHHLLRCRWLADAGED